MENKKKNFNEVLKAQEEERRRNTMLDNSEKEVRLDDTQRVKVISPGRMVFKRFVRNKLAIAGTVILIFMFVFSFIGPLFYAYGQTERFYKYDYLQIDYASAEERTEYASYTVNKDIDVHYSVANMLNAHINDMISRGAETMTVADKDGLEYVISREGENVYTLRSHSSDAVGTYGSIKQLGTYNTMLRQVNITNGTNPGSGFDTAVGTAIRNSESFVTFGGSLYAIEAAGIKNTYNVFDLGSGTMSFSGSAPGEGFKEAFLGGIANSSFEFDGESYRISGNYKDGYSVTLSGDMEVAIVATTYVFDAYDPSFNASSEFKTNAYLALYGGGEFTADGIDYVIKTEDDTHAIYEAGNEQNPVAMFSTFVVRRYSGGDTLSLDFKAAAQSTILDMEEQGSQTGSFVFNLPQLNENGEYVVDENGNYNYEEREITVTKKLNQYVLKCEQITLLIDIYAPSSAEHIFGTDSDGFDILARMMYGGRISLIVGFVVVILETFLGVIMGGIAGFFGGWVDTIIMRLVDVFYCIPTMPILIILGAFFDSMKLGAYQRLMWMMAVLGFLGWAGIARLVRGQILSLREQEFMTAAEATGIRAGRRIFRHLVPNVMPQLIVSATMGLGSVIIYEATLSFLGLGVKHPLATWGTMINSVTSSNENLARFAYIWIPVGLLICLTVIAFNFVGDGLRDAFDPKMKR